MRQTGPPPKAEEAIARMAANTPVDRRTAIEEFVEWLGLRGGAVCLAGVFEEDDGSTQYYPQRPDEVEHLIREHLDRVSAYRR